MIQEVVHEGRMPPWHASAADSGPFENGRQLTVEEKGLIKAWVDAAL